ncbi:MAG: bile acid:sodium symporter [Vicinamibacterales bacterium]
MQALIDFGVPLVAWLLMLAVGTDLRLVDFASVLKRPLLLIAGLVVPSTLLPLLAVGLIRLFSPPPGIEASLLLIAVCPIGGAANTYSYLARASTALSVSLTGLSCILAVVTIPLSTLLLEILLGRPFGFQVPVKLLIQQLTLIITMPIGIGMLLRHWWPDEVEKRRGLLQRLAFTGVALLVLFVVGADVQGFRDNLGITVPLAAAFVIGSFTIGLTIAISAWASDRDSFTLASEFATRNLAVATAIAITLLGRVGFAVFATTYLLIEVPLMLLAVLVFRSRSVSSQIAREST